MSGKVYSVESGDYSDHAVHAMFSTREKAEAFLAAFDTCRYSGGSIVEWDLDPVESDLGDRYEAFFVRIAPESGDITEFRRQDSICGFNENHLQRDAIGTLYTHILARDEEHARKIAVERMQQWRALNAVAAK